MLHKIIQKITGKPRYRPKINWFDGGFTYFLFRIPEFLFGREIEIRAESSAFPYIKDGKQYVEYHFYTKEAFVVHTEWMLRNYIKKIYNDTILKIKYFYWKLDLIVPQIVNIFDLSPQFAVVGHGEIPAQNQLPKGYKFAIAFDVWTSGGSVVGTVTFSHTVTGSNPLIAIGSGIFASGGTGLGTATYAGASATEAINGTLQTNAGKLYIWFKGSCATGANNVVVTPTNGTDQPFCYSTSYSGAQSGSTADASAAANSASGNAAVSVTTVADNCWVVGNWRNSGTSSSGGANTTVRGTEAAASNSMGLCDNNAAKTPAGSVTLNVNGTASWGMVGASFAPQVAAGPTNLKSYNTNLKANIKSIDTNPIANVKKLNTNA